MNNLNYLTDHQLIFNTRYSRLLWLYNQKALHKNPPITIYVNKIDKRIRFRIKTEHFLKLLTLETLKLLGSIDKKDINKDEYSRSLPHLEITEVVFVRCNVFNNDHQDSSRVLYIFVPNRSFGKLLDISPKSLIFLKTFNSNFSHWGMVYWSRF